MKGDQVGWAWQDHFSDHFELCRIDNNHFWRFTHADKIAVIPGIDGDTLSIPGRYALDEFETCHIDHIQRGIPRVTGQEATICGVDLYKIKPALRTAQLDRATGTQCIRRQNESRHTKE